MTTPTLREAAPDNLPEYIIKAIQRTWAMGQKYWHESDSESCAANRRSVDTHAKYIALLDEVRAALAQPVPDAALHTAVRLVLDATPEHLPMALDALRDHAGAAPVAQQAEPPADWFAGMPDEYRREAWRIRAAHPQQPARVPLTPREAELIDGMIARELDHAARCDGIANRLMGEKQKGWDMERVALLRKLAGIVPAPTTGGEG